MNINLYCRTGSRRAGGWTVRQRSRVRYPPSPLFYLSPPSPHLLLGPSSPSADSTSFLGLNRPAAVVVDALASALASLASATLFMVPPPPSIRPATAESSSLSSRRGGSLSFATRRLPTSRGLPVPTPPPPPLPNPAILKVTDGSDLTTTVRSGTRWKTSGIDVLILLSKRGREGGEERQ